MCDQRHHEHGKAHALFLKRIETDFDPEFVIDMI
jgi:hypothetical protein